MKIYITFLVSLILIATSAKTQTWESCTNGIEGESIKTLLVDGQRIYAGTGSGRIYITDNSGQSWIKADSLKGAPTVFAVYDEDLLAGTYNYGIFQSLNGGFVWTKLNKDTLEKGVRIIEVVGNDLYVLTEGPVNERPYGRISRSTDGGVTWTPVLTGKSYNWVISLTSIGSLLFVGTQQGDIYRSDNNGENWKNVSIDLPDKNIYNLKTQGTNLLVGSEEGRFYISTDLGLTWENANKGFPDDWVSAITVKGPNIFAGTNENGVYLSTDSGDSWNDFSDTLWNHHIQYDCLVANDKYLFCSTGGNYGIYRKDITGLINSVDDKSNQSFEIYPTPANDFITITLGEDNPILQHGAGNESQILIYNTLGEKVMSESIHPMTSSHRMNIESLPKGMYFVRIGGKVIKFTKY